MVVCQDATSNPDPLSSPPPQLRVIGPWPYGLLSQLHQCLVTLARDVLDVAVKATRVVCPSCGEMAVKLSSVYKRVSRGVGTMPCGHCVASLQWDRGEVDDSGGDDGTAVLEFGIDGYATWVANRSPSSAAKAVKHTFELASEHAASGNELLATAVTHQAWRNVERCVSSCPTAQQHLHAVQLMNKHCHTGSPFSNITHMMSLPPSPPASRRCTLLYLIGCRSRCMVATTVHYIPTVPAVGTATQD